MQEAWSTTWEWPSYPLRDSLKRKGGRYGNQLAMPYVIAVNSSEVMLTDRDFEETLFGARPEAGITDSRLARVSGEPRQPRTIAGSVPFCLRRTCASRPCCRKVTLSIDDEVIFCVRRRAEALGTSVNQLAREDLEQLVGKTDLNEDAAEFERLSGLARGESRGWKFNRVKAYSRMRNVCILVLPLEESEGVAVRMPYSPGARGVCKTMRNRFSPTFSTPNGSAPFATPLF